MTNSAFVFATDGENVASYTRNADGSLHQASVTAAAQNAGTSSSFLIQAMSLDHSGQTLYAMENAGSDDLFYYFFNISSGTPTLVGKIGPNVNYVTPLVFSPDNNFAYGFGCFHIGWQITGFHRSSDGSLSPITTSNDVINYAGNNQMYCPEGEAISALGYMAVADTELGSNTTGIGVYKLNTDGSLTLVPNSPMATPLPQGNGCCTNLPMGFDPTGQWLALAGNGGIEMYRLMPGGTLMAVGTLQQPGPNYLAVGWDSDNHLYAISSAGLFVFTNANGVLTPASGVPHSAGAAGSLAILPTH